MTLMKSEGTGPKPQTVKEPYLIYVKPASATK